MKLISDKLLIIATLALLCLDVVAAIGVSPPRIIIENMNRGESVDKQIFLSGVSPGDSVFISLDENIEEWVDVDVGTEFLFQDTKSMPVVFTITSPEDAPNGLYTGSIVFSTGKRSDSSVGVGASAISGVQATLTVSVTGDQIEDFTVKSASVPAIEEGNNLVINFIIDNIGNILAKPDMLHINVLSNDRASTLISTSMEFAEGVDPHTKDSLFATVENDLQVGSYWAELEIVHKSQTIFEQNIIFDVVPPGSLNKEGSIQEIYLKPSLLKNEQQLIEVDFRNTGQIPVDAFLKINIFKDDALIETKISDTESVQPGKAFLFSIPFTPLIEGIYLVEAVVHYDNLISSSYKEIFRVEDTPTGNVILSGESNPVNTMLLVVIFIVLLVLLLRKKK